MKSVLYVLLGLGTLAGVVLVVFLSGWDSQERAGLEPNGPQPVADVQLDHLVQLPSAPTRRPEESLAADLLMEEHPDNPEPLPTTVNPTWGPLERRADLRRQLLAVTKGPFESLWASGQYEVVEKLSSDVWKDEAGRPRPCELKFMGSEIQAVYLSEQEYPEIWTLLGRLQDVEGEIAFIDSGATLQNK